MLRVNIKNVIKDLYAFSPFACSLVYDVLVVVVPESARQLFVVHLWLVLAHPPSTSDLIRSIRIMRVRLRVSLLGRHYISVQIGFKADHEKTKIDHRTTGNS